MRFQIVLSILIEGFGQLFDATLDGQMVYQRLTSKVETTMTFLGTELVEGDEIKLHFMYDSQTTVDNPGQSPAEYLVFKPRAMRFAVGDVSFLDTTVRVIVSNDGPGGDHLKIIAFGGTNRLHLTLDFVDPTGMAFSDESLPRQALSLKDFKNVTGNAIDLQTVEVLEFAAISLVGTSYILGDSNGDGSVNLLDVPAFLDIGSQFNPASDVNCDGSHDLLDVAPFIDLLQGG